jgi:hypothetical protein
LLFIFLLRILLSRDADLLVLVIYDLLVVLSIILFRISLNHDADLLVLVICNLLVLVV